jgi:hypothetical protein
VLLALSVTFVAHARARATDVAGPTLTVAMVDRSTAGGAELAAARTRAGYVFENAGIRIAWSEPGASPVRGSGGSTAIHVMVVDGPGIDGSFDDAVLGFASPPARRAYVYYNRVETYALSRHVSPGWFLGLVMAHELAHVLLPGAGHAPAGVMAAQLRPDPGQAPAFTEEEARALCAAVTGEVTVARLGDMASGSRGN